MHTRRRFVQLTGGSALYLLAHPSLSMGQANQENSILVPANKGFTDDWTKALTARGTPEVYPIDQLKYIGMPVGGLCAGQLYLGGDGKLWLWDIFNRSTLAKNATFEGHGFGNADGSTYVSPWTQKSPLDQGFSIKYQSGSISGQRALDMTGGWSEITFEGKYPVGVVRYKDSTVPLSVKLEAFSPFIPLNFDDSSLPATVLRFSVTNIGTESAQVSLGGWLENAVLAFSSSGESVQRTNLKDPSGKGVLLTGNIVPDKSERPDILFEDFSNGTYDGWTTDGDAFGSSPVARKDLPAYMGNIGGTGEYIVTSHNFRANNNIEAADDATGTLTSKKFTIERKFINFFSGGGRRLGEAGVRLLIDGQPVLEQTGDSSNELRERSWDVSKYISKTATIQAFDQAKGPWGNVHLGKFVFTDRHGGYLPQEKRADYGSMTLSIVGDGKGVSATASLVDGTPQEVLFSSPESTTSPAKPIAAVQKSFSLEVAETAIADFVITWHFPNVDPAVNGPRDNMKHFYSVRFHDAGAVAHYVATNMARLAGDTMNWAETWIDSTLPHWFLRRTHDNVCNVATNTSYRFANGEFWTWEGVYSCEGTCTHVWGYTQALGRLFPELERALRRITDYGFALSEDGTIQYRGRGSGFAADGQACVILRTYRDHLMTADNSFLEPLWPSVKKAMDRLIRQANAKGLLDGSQHNTLDTSWYGEVSWLSGLFLAALRAAEEMAQVMGDSEYAQKCRGLFKKGSESLVPELFNGEYFINKVDQNNLDAINSGTGCEIDQLMGQSWAWQVGLGRIFPEKEAITALKSLFRYNFAPDAGHYHQLMKVGRWFAMPGESGLLLCTFPRPDWDFKRAAGKGPDWAALYLNECMTGFEYEAASNMIAEGLVQEGLSVVRAIHDRYAPSKRNPYNEIECGDHYSRAMASYACFISACGYEYRGPDSYISFDPRITPNSFKAAFTSAQGWGTFTQEATPARMEASVTIKWGLLPLKTLGLQPVEGFHVKAVQARFQGTVINATFDTLPDRLNITFDSPLSLKSGERLVVTLI